MLSMRGDNGLTEQARAETSPGIGIRGDLDSGSAMRLVGGEGVDEACCEKNREAVFSGDANEASASREGVQGRKSVVGESATKEMDKKGANRPGGGTETVVVRGDQHEARSNRRVGIVCAPRNYKRPQSLQNLKSSGAGGGYSTTISNGGTTQNGSNGTTTTTRIPPPAIPPRSPLRPRPHYQPSPTALVGTTPRATIFDITVDTPAPSLGVDEDDTQLILMPSLRESFGGSLTALLATLEAEAIQDKALPLPPDQEDELTIDDSDDIEEEDYDLDPSQPSSMDSLTLDASTCPASMGPTTPNQPTVMTKRVHALRELLSSERAYASDLALIRDIHIPLALGRSPPFMPVYANPLTVVRVDSQGNRHLSTLTARLAHHPSRPVLGRAPHREQSLQLPILLQLLHSLVPR